MICNLRMKFRQIDPDFDHIETKHSEGYRWSAFKVHKPIARWGAPGRSFSMTMVSSCGEALAHLSKQTRNDGHEER
jgi:hypothetical protein